MTNTKNKLKEYLLNNSDELRSVVSEINGWDGSLEYLQVHENDEEFFETFFENKTLEAVRATQFGDFRYSDDLVRFNGYGNLDTFSEFDYKKELEENIDDIIENILDKRSHLSLDDEIEEILEEDE